MIEMGLAVGMVLATVGAGAAAELSAAERAAVFEAAGFAQHGDTWRRCEEETPMASSQPGSIELKDLNGDGTPEAIVTESSLFCYGGTEGLVVILTKDGAAWRKVLDEAGMHLVKDTKHGDWFDVEVGGPGLQRQPVYHWNGKIYVKSK